MFKKLLYLLLLSTLIIIWGAFNIPKMKLIYKDKLYQAKICQRPITYKLVRLDDEFGISYEKASNDLIQAEATWEKITDTNLFEMVSTTTPADITVSFIFDSRQQNTNELKDITKVISSQQNDVKNAKVTFSQKEENYKKEVEKYKQGVATYQANLSDYETKKMLYSRGGYTQSEANELNNLLQNLDTSKKLLDEKLYLIRTLEQDLKIDVSAVNSKVDALNNDIIVYNSEVGGSQEIFKEAEFVSSTSSRDIYIYEFQNETSLKRLFAHELGHSLGMKHVEGENSILYMYNKGTNLTPTTEDMDELNTICEQDKNLFEKILLKFI